MIHAPGGWCGLAIRRPISRRSHGDRSAAFVRNMALASTTRPGCGQSLVCVPQNKASTGPRLSRWPTPTWFWHATWSKPSFVSGKVPDRSGLRNRCVAGCTHCYHRWACLHALTPLRNIAGQSERDEDQQGQAVCGRQKATTLATTGPTVMVRLPFLSFLAPFTELFPGFCSGAIRLNNNYLSSYSLFFYLPRLLTRFLCGLIVGE